MRLDAEATGLFPTAPMPFHADGRIDAGSVETLIAPDLAAGATAISVLARYTPMFRDGASRLLNMRAEGGKI